MRSLAELDREWSIDDVMQAHDVLDELDRAEADAYRNSRKRAEASRSGR